MRCEKIESIVFIATAQDMAKTAVQVTSEMGLSLPIETGLLHQVQDLAQKYSSINVIISRGKVAESFKKIPGKTVVQVPITMIDLLEPIQRIARKGINKVGVLAHITLLDDISQDVSLSDFNIYIRPWKDEEDIKRIITELRQLGVEGIVGDGLGAETAQSYGLVVEFLNSGPMSIKKAIIEAVSIAEAQEFERQREAIKAQEIQKYVVEIYHALEQAAAAIEQMNAASQEIATTSSETANIAKAANQEVLDTTKIVDIIRRIAKQSNLLGLNAAIEAARVGEYGRGFSVVAEEVRHLANESKQSAENIEEVLTRFRNSVNDVLKNVEMNSLITQEQSKATQEIAQKIEGLRAIGQKLMQLAE